MAMGMYMDFGITDFWYMDCYQDTTITCIYIALTYNISYGDILEWLRLILDLFSLSYRPRFLTTTNQLL